MKVFPGRQDLGPTANAAGADESPGLKVIKFKMSTGQQSILGIDTFAHGSELKAFGYFAGHVLKAVDRKVDLAPKKRLFSLFDKNALMVRQCRAIRHPVTCG
jgi:hypothetical protein